MPLAGGPTHDGTPARFVAPSLDAVARVDQREAVNARYEEARRAGFEHGYAEGVALADAEVNAAIQDHRAAQRRFVQAAAALDAAASDLHDRDAVALAAIEHDVIQLAIALATEIVGRELRCTEEPVVDAVHRALALAPDRGTATCHVHPDDADVATTMLADDPVRRERVQVLPDPRIEPGGCVVTVGDCRVDAQIGPAIARLHSALAIP